MIKDDQEVPVVRFQFRPGKPNETLAGLGEIGGKSSEWGRESVKSCLTTCQDKKEEYETINQQPLGQLIRQASGLIIRILSEYGHRDRFGVFRNGRNKKQPTDLSLSVNFLRWVPCNCGRQMVTKEFASYPRIHKRCGSFHRCKVG